MLWKIRLSSRVLLLCTIYFVKYIYCIPLNTFVYLLGDQISFLGWTVKPAQVFERETVKPLSSFSKGKPWNLYQVFEGKTVKPLSSFFSKSKPWNLYQVFRKENRETYIKFFKRKTVKPISSFSELLFGHVIDIHCCSMYCTRSIQIRAYLSNNKWPYRLPSK